jgi:hypothetical protein
MKLESSLPHSQQPTTCPCPESHQSTYPGPISVRAILILFSHLRPRLPSGVCLYFRFRQLSCPPLSSTCPAHLIPSETPLQTRYLQQRVAVPSGAEAANSIRKYSASNRIPTDLATPNSTAWCKPPSLFWVCRLGFRSLKRTRWLHILVSTDADGQCGVLRGSHK